MSFLSRKRIHCVCARHPGTGQFRNYYVEAKSTEEAEKEVEKKHADCDVESQFTVLPEKDKTPQSIQDKIYNLRRKQ